MFVNSIWRSSVVSKFVKQTLEGKYSASIAAFFFCFTILCIRAGARIAQADFWAEDGNIFLNEALQYGWRSVFIPHASYLHVLQRTMLLSTYSLFPLRVLPGAIAVLSLAIAAAVTSRWASRDYQWLLPTPYRWGLCLVLCLAPGLGEMLATLCNLNWFFTLWTVSLLLRDPSKEINRWEVGFTVGVFFSIGTGVLLFPLALWRFRKQQSVLVGLMVFFLIYVLVLFSVRDPSRTEMPSVQVIEWVRTYIRQFRTSVLLQPVFGDPLTIHFSLGTGTRLGGYLSFLCFFTIFPWCIKNRKDGALQGALIFLLSFSGWVFLVWMGRTLSIKVFQQPLGTWFFQNRYSFPMSWAAFLVWFMFSEAVFQRRAFLKYKGVALVVILGWTAYTSHYRFVIPAYGKESAWKILVPSLQSSIDTGCPKSVRVKVFPGDAFDFDYQAKENLEVLKDCAPL